MWRIRKPKSPITGSKEKGARVSMNRLVLLESSSGGCGFVIDTRSLQNYMLLAEYAEELLGYDGGEETCEIVEILPLPPIIHASWPVNRLIVDDVTMFTPNRKSNVSETLVTAIEHTDN